MDRESLYLRLPLPAQHWMATLEGWRLRRARFNREFHELLGQYRERGGWSVARVAAFRDERLRAAVAHAAQSMPHYRELFRRLDISPSEIRTLSDLQRLPILTRPEVQAAAAALVSEAVPRGTTWIGHTSGSTGTGLHFPVAKRANREQWAVWWRCWMDHGLQLGTPCLVVGGRSIVPLTQRRPPYWRYNRAGRQTSFSAYHLNRETAPHYLEEMKRSGAPWMHGYPSMISLLAGYALELGIAPRLRWVTLGAENVLPHQIAAIRAAFGVEPIQHYGMAEGAANFSLCRRGRLHVDEDFAAVEFVPLDGDQHRIVGTNFANPAFGLLRYDVGDVATVTGRSCDCGRPGRVVDRVDGRCEDFVITKRGALLGRLDHVFKDLTRVREAQIRQAEPGKMTIWIVKASGYGEKDERALRSEVLKRVGDDVAFDIEYTDHLPRTARGKLRFVVSTVPRGKIDSAV